MNCNLSNFEDILYTYKIKAELIAECGQLFIDILIKIRNF